MDLQSFECSTCQICLYGMTNYERHVNSLEHANRIHLKELENATDEATISSSNNMATKLLESSCKSKVKESMNKPPSMILGLQCELCQKQFSGNEPYQQHLESAGHKKKLALNQINFEQRCEICDKNFSGPVPYEQHMISNGHQKKVLDKESRQRGNLFAPFVAQDKADKDTDIRSQIQDANPLENSGMVNAIQSRVAGWRCDICDKNFTGCLPYDQHMSSNVHIKKLKEKEFLNKLQNKVHDVESSLNYEGDDLSSAHFVGLLICKVCDKSFSGHVPYEQHISSQVHKKKIKDQEMFKKLFNAGASSQIPSTSDCGEISAFSKNSASNNGNTCEIPNNICKPSANQNSLLEYKCEVCDKSFTGPVPFDQHLNSSTHQKKILQRTPQSKEMNFVSINNTPKNNIPGYQNWFCETCDIHCSGSVPYFQHVMSDAHCKKMQAFKKIGNNLAPLDLIDDNASEMSIEDNTFYPGKDEIDGMSPKAPQKIHSDLILGDVLKDLNVITPESLNVTTFQKNETIVFNIALK